MNVSTIYNELWYQAQNTFIYEIHDINIFGNIKEKRKFLKECFDESLSEIHTDKSFCELIDKTKDDEILQSYNELCKGISYNTHKNEVLNIVYKLTKKNGIFPENIDLEEKYIYIPEIEYNEIMCIYELTKAKEVKNASVQ